jgi:hypothetical protein
MRLDDGFSGTWRSKLSRPAEVDPWAKTTTGWPVGFPDVLLPHIEPEPRLLHPVLDPTDLLSDHRRESGEDKERYGTADQRCWSHKPLLPW